MTASLCACALACLTAPAWAQTSATLTWQSDYRFRGVSLNDGHPTPQLGVNLDAAAGWYLGGYASGVTLAERRGAQLLAYGGYARRMPAGWSWEAGATRSLFTASPGADYSELYAGLNSGRLSARGYYAPRYFGQNTRTLYIELNASQPLLPRLNLVGHLGQLRLLAGAPGALPHARYDSRIGLALGLGDWSVQLARTGGVDGTYNTPRYPRYGERTPRAWVCSASYAF